MIIRPYGSDLLFIRQDDHAALAATIMEGWQEGGLPGLPHRERILEAIRLHDIGWEEVDAAPGILPESGQPYHVINAPLEARQRVWPSAIDRLEARDPYLAAMVAHHAITVYSRFHRDPEWLAFFSYLERRRDGLVTDHRLDWGSLRRDYTFLGMGDRWSLLFCFGWLDPNDMEGFRATLQETAPGPEAASSNGIGGGDLRISPDPFRGGSVRLSVPARRIPDRRYESGEDLRSTLDSSPWVALTGIARGAA